MAVAAGRHAIATRIGAAARSWPLCTLALGTLGITAAHVRQLRLVALEDEARHGKLEALYRECGFARTSAAVRYESDTDFTYRLVPMFKRV